MRSAPLLCCCAAWHCESYHLVLRLININMLSLLVYQKKLPTRPAPEVQKVKDCRHDEQRAHGVCLHTGAVLIFVSELWKLESRSLTGALKRGRIGCREDRRVTRIHNTGRGLARCDPVPLTHLYRRINMQGEAEAQQQMAANPPMMTKGRLKPWNIITYPRSGTDLRQAIQPEAHHSPPSTPSPQTKNQFVTV